MILQHFIYPEQEMGKKEELYIKTEQGAFLPEREGISLEGQGSYSFFTYFNSFSIGKWVRYTDLTNFFFHAEITGFGTIRLFQAVLQGTEMVCRELAKESYDAPDARQIEIEVPENIYEGILYVVVETDVHTHIQNAAFGTSKECRREISIAVGICTYRREEQVCQTLNELKEAFFEQKDGALYQRLRIYVSDNGNTLPQDTMCDEHIQCFPNKNAGGASGFTRTMLEALKDQDQRHYTHFLFMDDDVTLEPEVIYRTYCLLTMASDAYQGAAVGGALLRGDQPHIQHASGEVWAEDKVGFTKRGYDLSSAWDLLRNESIVSVDYNGWWYYAVPFSTETANNLPLPFFIHMDDVEYGLRFPGEIIYCNGIGVWHDAFDHRKASSMEYYDMRNLLIMNALRRPEYTWRQARKRVWKHLIFQRLKYRYRDAALTIRGVEDYCRGIDFLKEQDPVRLHQEIIEQGYTWTGQRDRLNRIKSNWAEKEEIERLMQQSIKRRFRQFVTLNGWLLPVKRQEQALPMGVSIGALYRAGRVLYYEPETGKGFMTKRNWHELRGLLHDMRYVSHILQKQYEITAQEWRAREGEITSRAFWVHYLEL